MHKRFLAVQVTRLSRIHIDWTWVGVDAVLVSLAWLGALVLRYDVDIVANVSSRWFAYLPIWSGTALACNVVAGVYSGVWRQASVYEARRVLFASGVCSAVLSSLSSPSRIRGRFHCPFPCLRGCCPPPLWAPCGSSRVSAGSATPDRATWSAWSWWAQATPGRPWLPMPRSTVPTFVWSPSLTTTRASVAGACTAYPSREPSTTCLSWSTAPRVDHGPSRAVGGRRPGPEGGVARRTGRVRHAGGPPSLRPGWRPGRA